MTVDANEKVSLRVGVTGSEKVTASARDRVLNGMLELAADGFEVVEFTTGAAAGVDTIAWEVGHDLFPDALHRVCFPRGCRFNADLVAEAYKLGDVVEAVDGGFMARNDRIVSHSELLLAYPRSRSEALRSGTWATVRRGRAASCSIWFFPLNGMSSFREDGTLLEGAR